MSAILHRVREVVGATGYMTPERGKRLFDFMVKNKLGDVLELGFAHGVSTCYLAAGAAAAMENAGVGSVVSIDRLASAGLKPRAEDLLERAGLEDMVTIHREPIPIHGVSCECSKRIRHRASTFAS